MELKNELQMISGLAFTRVILRDAKLDIDQGLIVLLDSKSQARAFGQIFEENLDGKMINRIKKKDGILNFEAGIYPLNGNENEETVLDFLAEKSFLPVITVGGMLPFFLRESTYVIRVHELKGMEDFRQEYKRFRTYIIKNVSYIRKRLNSFYKRLCEEDWFDRRSEYYIAFKSIITVGFMWYVFYEKTSTEEITEQFWKQYLGYTYRIIGKFRDYQDCYEMETEFVTLTWKYLQLHSDVILCNAEEVTIAVQKSMKEEEVILYDSEFYYFPEKLVKIICSPMLETISVGELKVLLKAKGIIFCNDEGYTIKKRFWMSSGVCDRMRAMKIKKEMLMSSDGLLLEDVYEYASEEYKNTREEILCRK